MIKLNSSYNNNNNKLRGVFYKIVEIKEGI